MNVIFFGVFYIEKSAFNIVAYSYCMGIELRPVKGTRLAQ